MNQIIKTPSVNFEELVKSSSSTLSLNIQTEMIKHLTDEFTEDEQKWYIANLYVYMNYHPIEDYPINLENVYKMIGFANKGNAMKTIKSNFILDEDYKIVIFRTEKNLNSKDLGGRPIETVMLNIDTFKNLCMIAKTENGKKIRKYYVKLENLYNKLVKLELEEKQKEVELKNKLLQEKDLSIAKLKNEEYVNILYIAHNPIIKNNHKIGILKQVNNKLNNENETEKQKTNDIYVRLENHKSSNPQFEYLFTYETTNAKLIEDAVKLLLKSFKMSKPEWFYINYNQMKKVVDFCIMMYDTYYINDSIENLTEFLSRYRSNRLVNANKARVIINKDVYEDYVKDCVVYGPQLRVSTDLICNDFYEWYKEKYPTKSDLTHIKLETGNWSTEFQKEITKSIESITGIDYLESKNGISLSDKKRGIYFAKCAGFRGMELRSMIKKVNYFDKSVYKEYVKEFIRVTNNPKNKVSRTELLDDFLLWFKKNNFTCKNKIYCRNSVSSAFKDVFIENIEEVTGLKFQNVTKITHYGCFVGMTHSKYLCNGKESCIKNLTDRDYIKKYIDNWLKNDSTSISKIFKKCIMNNNRIDLSDVKIILDSKHNIDLTKNKKKHKWYLIFEKNNDYYFIKKEALDYYNEIH
jgi:phage anti-repressor protein